MPRASSAAVLAFMLAVATSAQGQPPAAGRIKIASGEATIVRQGATITATAGQLVYEADRLRTGPDGRLGVTLKDETRISLGPNSEAQLDRFLYAPANGGVALAVTFFRGIAAYISGHIAKLAPDAIRLETPSAILAVRGTHVVIRVE